MQAHEKAVTVLRRDFFLPRADGYLTFWQRVAERLPAI
jgi:hypothetical protein